MAIYHFSAQIMNNISKHTGKPKSPLSAAAYRSGEKLYDEKNNTTYFYKRDVQPVTHILVPKHAPEWASNREKLWNEVNKIEKNVNAQFAREINIALPVELSDKEQEKLALDFCQEAFVDRGMVADIAIHRDDLNNPHFHVMLTMRPFNNDGTWGVKAKREYKFDDNGNHILDKNGKKSFVKVETTDWNNKSLFQSWRKLWSDKANYYLKQNGIKKSISHLSNEDRGLETMPTIHEGFVSRKMEKNGETSDRVSINKEIRKYNNTIAELKKYRNKKEQLEYQNKFFRKFSPTEKRKLSEVAKQLKMFVNSQTLNERKQQLVEWKKSIQFSKDSESKLRQLNRIDKEETLITEAEKILNLESDRFIGKYYPTWDIDSFEYNEKIAIVDKTIELNRLLTEDEVGLIEEEVYETNLLNEINSILKNRFAFVLTVNSKLEKLTKIRLTLENKLGVTASSNENKIKEAMLKHPGDFEKFKSIIRVSSELFKARDLIDELYSLEISKHYPLINTDSLTIDEKEILLVGTEYYEQPITLDSIPMLSRYTTEEQSRIIMYLTEEKNENINFEREFPNFQLNNPRYLMFFKDECLRNIKELPNDVAARLKLIDPVEFAVTEIEKNGIVKELNWRINQEIDDYSNNFNSTVSLNLSGVTNGLMKGLLEDRSYSSKKQFEEDLKSKSKKMKRRTGPSL